MKDYYSTITRAKVLNKFILKIKIQYYIITDLKDEAQEYDIQLNQLLTQFVEKNNIELKVVVERIVKEIKQQDAEEAVDLFFKNLYN